MHKTALALALVAGCAVAAGPAGAHHSGAMFDRSKIVELKGQVIEYQFANPHSWIRLMVRDGAAEAGTEWDVETNSPPLMRRFGVTPSNLKPGDVVSLRMHPLHDGRHGGSLVDITLADGKLYAGPQHAQ